MTDITTQPPTARRGLADWPPEVRAVMQVLCRNPHFGGERRRHGERKCYHAEAAATFSNAAGAEQTATVYTRNVSPGHVAFICTCVIRTGDRVSILFPLPNGESRPGTGTVRRCRQFLDGWFECVVRFDPPQEAKPRRWLWLGRGKNKS